MAARGRANVVRVSAASVVRVFMMMLLERGIRFDKSGGVQVEVAIGHWS